ncbi:BUD32 protein kinase [Thecamonas trahens ATCC 50062]|uniref:non-specific serine/threonine protein kinase n=1 Tax=Thecamonas trahens ATCC 50062 TaxID=461836 RepID=A0A0L0D8B5_THETB|nr:BUD32 protein kinase [Thecamonas trahens ATCC 50062]KNC48321.1 BUD32 protein kinase [Thecamonas trahens ATCC 50062]|eukprot:XP_013758888.1 BUD32 protein kinase [Thecamonas trahens ATCC 50062]
MATTSAPTPTPALVLPGFTLLAQGAEARVYIGRLGGLDALAKHRFVKGYRHKVLDDKLRAAHTVAEARSLARARALGVPVPGVLMVDTKEMVLYMELVHGITLKAYLQAMEGLEIKDDVGPHHLPPNAMAVLAAVGKDIALLHNGDVVHGDLTTSNFMLRPRSPSDAAVLASKPLDPSALVALNILHLEVVTIDFGLASVAQSDGLEDKAVDLYVLERAFISTHPFAEHAFAAVLGAYAEACANDDAVLGRLEDVRARGRKRDMFG